jgi:hypothetical protein
MTEKTLFMVMSEDHPLSPFFFEKEGNYEHLNRIYLRYSRNGALCKELEDILESLPETSVMYEPTKDWTYFVQCG